MTAAPVRIAFCITELDRGGAERALTQLVLGLDRQEWRAQVYCLGPRGHFADELEAGQIPVTCFNARGITSLPRVIIQLVRELRLFRPVLLQTFLFHGNLVGRFAARLARVPVVVSGIRVADRRSRWYGRLDRWTNRLVNHNVCVSQGVADFAVAETGLRREKISVIPNGVDFARFANASPADLSTLQIPAGAPIIITVGRLEEQKGIVYLLHAAATVLREVPGCHFLIAGDGPDRAALQALADSLGIAGSIHFLGGRSDVPELLKASSAFVLPSLWEGMPNALLEAMASGLPAIATAVEGSREILVSGQNGLLVEPANSIELSRAILSVLRDSQDSLRLAHAAQALCKSKLTESAAVRAYQQLYSQLIRRT